MTPVEAAAVLIAGIAAGALNTIVGSGSLLTFPTLLAVGLPPITANVSNTIGLVPGGISGTLGYRRELAGQRDRLVRLGDPGTPGRDARCGHPAGPAAGSVRGGRAVPAALRCRADRHPAAAHAPAGIGTGAARARQPVGGAGRVRDRHLRRLLRCGSGRDPDGIPAGPRPRRPAAAQRPQERTRRPGQRDCRGDLRPRRAPLGRGGDPCGRLDRRRAARRRRRARLSPEVLRAAIVIVGTVVALRMLFPG